MEPTSRKATHQDRLCDICNQPMIGIMRVSGDKAPRRIGDCCDGVPCTHPTEHPDLVPIEP